MIQPSKITGNEVVNNPFSRRQGTGEKKLREKLKEVENIRKQLNIEDTYVRERTKSVQRRKPKLGLLFP